MEWTELIYNERNEQVPIVTYKLSLKDDSRLYSLSSRLTGCKKELWKLTGMNKVEMQIWRRNKKDLLL